MILKTIKTRNKNEVEFQIDDEDFNRVSQYEWWIGSQGYPRTVIDSKIVKLHIFLFGPPEQGLIWDHEDRNPLNNHRKNLRQVTPSFNGLNRGYNKNNTSGVKGVILCYTSANRPVWLARIQINKKQIRLGLCETKEEAMKLRLMAEMELGV